MKNFYVKMVELLSKKPEVQTYLKKMYEEPVTEQWVALVAEKDKSIQILNAELIDAGKRIKEHEEALKDIKNINLEKTAESGKIVKKRKYTKKNGKKGHATEQAQSNKN